MTVPNTFGSQTGPIPLSQLDDNFAALGSSSNISFIASGTGAVATTVQSKLRQVINIADFGTLSTLPGDGAANKTIIQAALDAGAAAGGGGYNGGAVVVGVVGRFPVTGTLVINTHCDLSMMWLDFDATVTSNAIRVGPNTVGNYLFDRDIKLPLVYSPTVANWTGITSTIGVEIANVYQSRIEVRGVYNYGIGLKMGGYGVGCVYNTITIGVLANNKINQQLKPGNATGWCNQNTIIGGRYTHTDNGVYIISGVRHIQLRDYDAVGTDQSPNNNTWINPSVEGDESEFHLDIQGAYNTFITPRLEIATAVPARIQYYADSVGQTFNNTITGGFDITGTTYTFTGPAGGWIQNKKFFGSSNDALEYSGCGISIVNKSGSALSNPHFQGFLSSESAITKSASSTDWIYRLHGNGADFKGSTDTQSRVSVDAANGFVLFSRGSVAATNYLRAAAPAGAGLICGGDGTNGSFIPDSDNKYPLGGGATRWSVVYAGTGTINTSDYREKQDITALSEAEKRVAAALKGLIVKFRFIDAVQDKGDDARIHVGVIVQEVIAAFHAEGLDPFRYGMVCYDEWDATPAELDEDGKVLTPARAAGNRYGVRYVELLAFIISAL